MVEIGKPYLVIGNKQLSCYSILDQKVITVKPMDISSSAILKNNTTASAAIIAEIDIINKIPDLNINKKLIEPPLVSKIIGYNTSGIQFRWENKTVVVSKSNRSDIKPGTIWCKNPIEFRHKRCCLGIVAPNMLVLCDRQSVNYHDLTRYIVIIDLSKPNSSRIYDVVWNIKNKTSIIMYIIDNWLYFLGFHNTYGLNLITGGIRQNMAYSITKGSKFDPVSCFTLTEDDKALYVWHKTVLHVGKRRGISQRIGYALWRYPLIQGDFTSTEIFPFYRTCPRQLYNLISHRELTLYLLNISFITSMPLDLIHLIIQYVISNSYPVFPLFFN